MAIVQISKIIHRIGANIDLPQLDVGEIGFSTDTRQVFIGNDPVLYPPTTELTTQTEILTDQSSIDFARLNGSEGVTMLLENPYEGQILGFGFANSTVTLTNLGGNAVSSIVVTRPKIDLGDIANVTITGTAFNGAVLQTDGTGNLSWTAQTTGGTITNNPGGSNSQIQINDAGSFYGTNKLVFDKGNGNLDVNGNISVTSDVTASNFLATSNGLGTNYKVGDDAYIGDVNVSDTIQIMGVANSANAYIIFGDTDTTSLGRSGSGPLTYGGDLEITGNITCNNMTANTVALDTWSLFANVDGLFATDGANTYSINMTQI